jgi:hypothetical protein
MRYIPLLYGHIIEESCVVYLFDGEDWKFDFNFIDCLHFNVKGIANDNFTEGSNGEGRVKFY